MEQTEKTQVEGLAAYCQRLEEIVSKRSAEFTVINKMLTRESRERRVTEDGLLLRATILDNTGEAVFLVSRRGEFTYANETAITIYGYSRYEFLTMKLYQLLEPVPEALELESQRLEDVFMKGELEFHCTHRRKDGSLIPVNTRYRLVRTPHGGNVVIVARDITRELNLLMRLERLPGIIWTTDADLRINSVTGAGLETTGLEICPATGMTLLEYLEMMGASKEVRTTFQQATKLLCGCLPVQFNIAGKSMRGWIVPFHNTAGELLGTTSFLMDVTQ